MPWLNSLSMAEGTAAVIAVSLFTSSPNRGGVNPTSGIRNRWVEEIPS